LPANALARLRDLSNKEFDGVFRSTRRTAFAWNPGGFTRLAGRLLLFRAAASAHAIAFRWYSADGLPARMIADMRSLPQHLRLMHRVKERTHDHPHRCAVSL